MVLSWAFFIETGLSKSALIETKNIVNVDLKGIQYSHKKGYY